MRCKKLLVLMLACAAFFICALSVSAASEGYTGWEYDYDLGGDVYYIDGNKVTDDWIIDEENDLTYYVGADGLRYQDDVYRIGDAWYAFDNNGLMQEDKIFYTQEYDEELGYYVSTFYCVRPDGKLYQNAWAKPTNGIYEGDLNERWFYAGADCVTLKGKQLIGGKYYYFDEYDGAMFYGETFTKDNAETGEMEYYYAYGVERDGALAHNQWILNEQGDWNYYGADCTQVIGEIATIGGKLYGFDYSGDMYYDEVFDRYNETTQAREYYYAQGGAADGALLTNAWHQTYLADDDTSWFYYGADGVRYHDRVAKIGGKYYHFDSWGAMLEDRRYIDEYWDEDLEMWINRGSYCARADGSLYVNEWYEEDGCWYYYGAEGKSLTGIQTVSGRVYCFDEYGMMLEDTFATVTVGGVDKYYIVDEDGYPTETQNNTWKKVNGEWYYVQDGLFAYGGIYEIDGKYYGFDRNGRMYDGEMFELRKYDEWGSWIGWGNYYAKPGGELARNEVVFINRYGTTEPYLFGDDHAIPDAYGLYEMGGKVYFVRSYYSSIISNAIVETEAGVYRFGKDGVGTLLNNGWHKDTTSVYRSDWRWIYVQDGVMLSDGIYEIGGKRYAFDYDGWLLSDGIYEDYENGCYWLLTYMDENGNGGSVCEEKNVWKTVHGEYVYLTEDSTLHIGWLSDTYYMTPYMTYCKYVADDELYVYTVNMHGQAKKMTTTGFISIRNMAVYVENGKVVTEDWRKIGGEWYYFNAYGDMYMDGAFNIGDKYYAFDSSGRMVDNGWFRNSYGYTYWAYPSGELFTGIDSAGYVFTEYGLLITDDVITIDGVCYVTNNAGKKIGSFTEPGWNKVGNNWYYMYCPDPENDPDDKQIMRGEYYDERGRLFVFDEHGRMLSNQFYQDNSYYLGSNGDALKGWIWVDKNWYYGDPENYGYLYNEGTYDIDGEEYIFRTDGALRRNETFYSWTHDAIITVNGDGVITNMVDANGWTYDEDNNWGGGEVFYYKNGELYDGWLGKYYIDDGRMCINEEVYDADTDKYYFVNKRGVKVVSDWHEPWEDSWVLAGADGALVHDDWRKIGNIWYYFDGIYMVYDGIYEINGVEHEFDENGVWIGEYKENTALTGKADGWVKHNGKWYFSMAGEIVFDTELYIDGKWYYFDGDGVMVTNQFVMNYNSAVFGLNYYGADGDRKNYVGWQWINSKWVYFTKDHAAIYGWINDGGQYYYQDFYTNDDDYNYWHVDGAAMVTGYYVIDDVLYYFNGGGVLTKTITTPGWYKGGSDWYYVDGNGNAVSGVDMYKIDGVYYAFDYDGKMIANEVYNGRYYNANGAMVTTYGWYSVDGDWIYVTKRGTVAQDGVFLIGGKEYYFYDYIWIG